MLLSRESVCNKRCTFVPPPQGTPTDTNAGWKPAIQQIGNLRYI
jgi:hypothetical protein